MGEGSLELTIVAAAGLKNVNSFFSKCKLSPYAVAWIDPQLKKSTKILQNSGPSPVWNDTLSFPLQSQLLNNPNAALIIQILCAGLLNTKIIGTTTLMLNEIKRICSMTERDEGETFTLQLWRPSGRAYGILKVALKLKGSSLFEMPVVPHNWVPTNSQSPNWAFDNPPKPNRAATYPSQPCDIPVQGIPVVAFYPQVDSLAVPLDTMENSTSYEQCDYPHTPQTSSSVVMPFPLNASPGETAETSTLNDLSVYSNEPQPQLSPAYMPHPPTAPPLQQNNAPKNFFIGLLSGAVAAVLVGSAMM